MKDTKWRYKTFSLLIQHSKHIVLMHVTLGNCLEARFIASIEELYQRAAVVKGHYVLCTLGNNYTCEM